MKITINSITSGRYSTETIAGREHLVTTIMPIMGNTAMNGIFYPDEEVELSYKQLDMIPAPNGHPRIDGELIPAYHPVAINVHNIGGFIRNPRKEGLKVFTDFVIDVEVANRSDDGKELIKRIEKGNRTPVSTGLRIGRLDTTNGVDSYGETYEKIGGDFTFDHVAVLLYEEAAGKHAGTEFIVNSKFNWDSFLGVKNMAFNVKEFAEELIANKNFSFSPTDEQQLSSMTSKKLVESIANNIIWKEPEGFNEYQENKLMFNSWKKERLEQESVLKVKLFEKTQLTKEMLANKQLEELIVLERLIANHTDRMPENFGNQNKKTIQDIPVLDFS